MSTKWIRDLSKKIRKCLKHAGVSADKNFVSDFAGD